MIRDIVFDLGKVLCPFDWAIAQRRLLPYLPPETAQLIQEDSGAFKALFHDPAVALETGLIEFQSFHRIMEKILKIELDGEEFHRIWCDIFSVNEEMIALGEFLSGRYWTWLASNTSKVHYEWIIRHFPRVAFYRAAFLSYEVGIMKPDAAYYGELIRKFAIDPPGAIFIDDLEENVRAATRAGMKGILYRDLTHLREDLGALGIELPHKGTGKE